MCKRSGLLANLIFVSNCLKLENILFLFKSIFCLKQTNKQNHAEVLIKSAHDTDIYYLFRITENVYELIKNVF